jgi:hypothetical protein
MLGLQATADHALIDSPAPCEEEHCEEEHVEEVEEVHICALWARFFRFLGLTFMTYYISLVSLFRSLS